MKDGAEQCYVFLDEIQEVADIRNPYLDSPDAKIGFTDVLLGLMRLRNVDLYGTGSSSHLLSSDIMTEFRGRGDEIRVNSLTYREFYEPFPGEKRHAWREYCTYGGMPLILSMKTHEEKSRYLKDLFVGTYFRDVLERNHILNDRSVLEDLLSVISSSVGSLTNPTRLSNTFRMEKQVSVAPGTIEK